MADVVVVATVRMASGHVIVDEAAGSGERGALPWDARGTRYCGRGHSGVGRCHCRQGRGKKGKGAAVVGRGRGHRIVPKAPLLQLDCPSDGHWDVVGTTS